ncbi:MAG TPA: amino acid adenylation domain-containing protein, partial [Thermoanaerobaculia bacterium]|nr:amino acid adenylation domain-containing protein [Thermoanaerobaculia bacterium]
KLILGTPSGHRIQPELQEVLGFFLNQLVFYTDLTGNPSLLEVTRRVKETAVGAYAHEELPFPRLVEALRPGRDLSRTPFTQVVLLLLNPQQMAEQLGGDDPSAGLGVNNYWVDAHRTQFDMTLSMWESRASPVLSGWWEHNTDLFDATTMDRMKEQFRTMAAAFVTDPHRPLWDVPLLTEPQRQQLLVEWAGGSVPASGPLLPARVAEHAARAPEAAALVFEDRVLTYGDLDRRSNRLAHALRRQGVGPESRVGLRIERSPEMLVAVLGVWKAGGAYVPLDPDLPEARLAYLIQDSGAALVLTGETLAELEAAEVSEAPLEPLAALSNVAYVIYTSGTTGQPKGVVIEHSSMLAVLEAGRRFLGLTAADRVSALASFSFDASVFEVYTALLAGACVHLYGLRPALDFDRLVADLGRLTALHAVPVLMRQIVERARPAGPFPDLREVQMGADRVPLDLAAEVAEVFPRANIRVFYGPTETTVICAQGLLSEYGTDPRVGTPMGRPMESAVVRLLDRYGGPVPPNVAGEVWIGGPGVARGYLNRPELTAEKFPMLDGQRFYRSGDLARWRGDGLLEFLGRVDQQVKVRGFRIEPGEIEAALTARPEVREAVVAVRHAPDARLVAYVVPGDTEVSTDALRDHLRERLPEYMVPAAWVVLPALPLTSSGKVDRKALPEPEAPAAGETVAPRTPVEERLAAIWSEVLGVPNIGVHDNFFTLGGDSILSIQVITRAQRDGIALTPRMLFQYQTVAELAAAAGSVAGVKAEQGPVTGPVSFTPIQRWFFDHKPPEPWHDNQALLLESRRRLDPVRLDAALARIALHHDTLRLRFRRGVIGWEQWGAVPEGTSPLLTVDLSALPEAACPPQIEAAAAAAQRSLDLSQGPLHRPVLFDLGADQPGRFLWVIHHLAVDGVSWRLLLEDLAAAYDGLPLPAKTTSYKEWSDHLADFSEAEVLRRETDWWLERPWSEILPLPADGPAPPFRETLAEERSVSLSLDPEETRALLQEVPRVYNSQINDALLSALARACQSWTGSPVLLLDLEGHGREEIFPDVDLSRTVGWFTSVFPVLLDLRDAAGPGEALKAVKEHLRRIPNGGLGWGLLQASPESGRIARLPRPEVGFNYLGQVDQGLPKDLPFGGAAESAGANRSPWAPRPHRLEWNGSVSGGRLHFICTYGADTFRRDTVERLVAGLERALRELIEHCRTPEAGGYTPSDFPLASLSQGQLDKILARRKKPQ